VLKSSASLFTIYVAPLHSGV